MSGGYLTLFRVAGVPVRLHWSTPLAPLLMTGFRFVPGAWVGVLLVILIHELGHLFFVLKYRLRAISVEMTALGGLCRYAGMPEPIPRAVIAWGGVIGQSVLLVGAFAWLLALGTPEDEFGADLTYSLTQLNLLLAVINLVPFPPLDGSEAWKLFPLLRAKRRERARAKAKKTAGSATSAGPSVRIVSREDGRDVLVFDEAAVEDGVKEALDRAARDARDKRKKS